jgi:tRNA (guanine-N7-)-methyltransferase
VDPSDVPPPPASPSSARPPRPYASPPRLPDGDRIDLRALIAPAARFELEIGPGRGGFIIDRLAARPDVVMVGLEIRRKWATIVDQRLERRGLSARGRVFAEDVRFALPRLGPDAALGAVFLHFPDPWWKKRHQKRLVIGGVLLDEIARLLHPAGELFVQTDVEERAGLYEDQIGAHPAFHPSGDVPGSPRLAENPYEARSHRERRAVADAIPIYRLRYARR